MMEPRLPAGSLQSRLESLITVGDRRALVVKTSGDDDFVAVLTAFTRATPTTAITSLVAGESIGAEEEIGEVLRVKQGWRPLLRRLRGGFDVCLIVTGPRRSGGTRRALADLAALVSRARRTIVCSPHQVLAVHGRPAVALASVGSGATLALGVAGVLVVAVLCHAIAVVTCLVGEPILRLLRRTPH